MKESIIDPGLIGFICAMAIAATVIIFEVFKWGHDKEARGERYKKKTNGGCKKCN